jgi:hypothetical protein
LIKGKNMNIQELEARKVKLISSISLLYDENVLQELEHIMHSSESDWWDSIDNYEREVVKAGLEDYKKNNLIDNDTVRIGAEKIINS